MAHVLPVYDSNVSTISDFYGLNTYCNETDLNQEEKMRLEKIIIVFFIISTFFAGKAKCQSLGWTPLFYSQNIQPFNTPQWGGALAMKLYGGPVYRWPYPYPVPTTQSADKSDNSNNDNSFISINTNTGNYVPESNEIEEPIHYGDLFSGDLELKIPLFNFTDKNGLTLNLKAVYSSSGVKDIVEEKYELAGEHYYPANAKNQVSCLGLGWDFNLPKIALSNYYLYQGGYHFLSGSDQPYYISEELTTKLIEIGGNKYATSICNYHKIKKISNEDGWTIYDTNGIKYTFGHFRKTIDFYDYIYNNETVLDHDCFVSVWDITKIEDTFGNYITISYNDTQGDITYKYKHYYIGGQWEWRTWNSQDDYPNGYTKTSYINKISNSRGRVLKFNYSSNRLDVPSTNDNEERNYRRPIHFQDKLVSNIELYDMDPEQFPNDAQLIKRIEFNHDYSDLICGTTFKKLLLESIQEKYPSLGGPVVDLPAFEFTYKQNDATLESVILKDGGTFTYTFDDKTYSGDIVGYKLSSTTASDGYNESTTNYFYNGLTKIVKWPLKYYGFQYTIENLPDYQNTGSIKHTFEVSEDHLQSLELTREYRNPAESNVMSIQYDWDAHQVIANEDVYDARLNFKTTTLDNIITTVTYNDYNDDNGLPNQITETNSDGTCKITKIKYAFEIYNTMDDIYNIISPECQRIIYENNISDSNVKSSFVTTWTDMTDFNGDNIITQDEAGIIRFDKRYSWNAKQGETFIDFDGWGFYDKVGGIWGWHPEYPTDSRWILQFDVDRLDVNGNVLMLEDANGIMKTTKWGYNNSLPIAGCRNGNDEEFSFTSFENGEGNGWDHENQIIIYEFAHTGENVVQVDTDFGNGSQYGPTQDFYESEGLEADTGFKASVWVKGPSTAYLKMSVNNSSPSTPPAYSLGSGDWELLEVELTKQQIESSMNGDDYIRVFVGNNTTTPAYFDDIRFHPTDALMTAITYDPRTFNVISVSNENNQAIHYEYDEFGRLKETRNAAKELLSFFDYYYSLENHENFDPIHPNSISTTTYYSGALQGTAIIYYDGRGREIQTQLQEGNDDIVIATEYDLLGRVEKGWKPYLTNTEHQFAVSYQSGATSYYDGNPGPISGGYPYSQTQYDNDPLNRIDQIGNPGNDFRIGSTHEIDHTYGSNSNSIVIGGITYQAGSLYKTEIEDEKGNNTAEYKDKFGNTVYMIHDPSGLDLITGFKYNIIGKLTASFPPKYFETENNVWITEMKYNTLGQLIEKETPDAGTAKYKYDNNDNLRFIQDQLHDNGGNDLVFYKYDEMNSIISIGEATTDATIPVWNELDGNTSYINGNYNFESESAHPDNFKIINRYDSEPTYGSGFWADAVDPGDFRNVLGRLTATAYFDENTNNWGYTYYSYDNHGNIEWIVQDLPGEELGIKKISYQYDRQDNIIKTSFNDSQNDAFYVWRDYDQKGRLQAI